MTEPNVKVQCPFCQGRGELTLIAAAEKLANPEFRKRLDAGLAEILESVELAAAGAGLKVRDFEKDVHGWNPRLPMWRRSQKE